MRTSPPPPGHQSKHSIKIMFLVAVAMPQLLSNGFWFNGKIGILLVIKIVLAKRSSKNRAAGATVIDQSAWTGKVQGSDQRCHPRDQRKDARSLDTPPLHPAGLHQATQKG
ncbi:unnamed protein product [Discosporangium mesarthrocarpum]